MVNPIDGIICWLSELGLVFAMNRGNWRSAIRHSSRALLIKPHDADILGMRGVAQLSLGNYERAIADLSQALQLQPTADTYINRAIAYRDAGEFEQSIVDCDEALKLRPQDISIYIEKAQTYRKSGDFNEAIVHFKSALKHDNEPSYYVQLAETQAEGGEWDSALTTWQQALEISSDDPEIYFSRGKAYAYRGEMEHAKADFESARKSAYAIRAQTIFQLQPFDVSLTTYLAVTNEALGNPEKALELWHTLLKIEPNYNNLEWLKSQKIWFDWMQPHAETIIAHLNDKRTTNNE